MQLSHAAAAADIAFDDPNLIGDAGLVQAVGLRASAKSAGCALSALLMVRQVPAWRE